MKLMNKKMAGGIAAAAAGVATVLAMSGAAQATDPITITGGPDANFVGTNVEFTAFPSGQVLDCHSQPGAQFDLAGHVVNPGVPRAHSSVAGELDSLTATNCYNTTAGPTAVTPNGSWDIYITGDPASGTSVWPAELRGVSADVVAAGCAFVAEGPNNTPGVVAGTFDTGSQVFTPTSSNLTVNDPTPDPSGGTGMCAILDIWDGDPVAIDGYWTNIPPSGSTAIGISH